MSTKKKNAGAPGMITSPEQLNDYVKVSNLSVWLFLAAVIVLLAGFFVWGFVGRLDTTYLCPAAAEGGHLRCFVDEDHGAALADVESVTVNGKEYPVEALSQRPIPGSDLSPYMRHVSGLSEDDWVYVVYAETYLSDGVYEAVICTGSVRPIAFLVG